MSVSDSMEVPGGAGAPVALLAFGWHTWDHGPRTGMNLLGFLIAFALASLVAVLVEEVARCQRDIGRRPRGRTRR